MKRHFCIIVLALLIAACGYDPEKSVYNTADNPDQFPLAALSLLDGIDSGTLNTYDDIISGFADLYTDNSSLLDNQQWKAVIDRLGVKFKFRAEGAVEDGIDGYSDAAAMYLLASFAKPNDAGLQNEARLFGAWEKLVTDSIIRPPFAHAPMEARTELLRQFEAGDSLQRAFSVRYLRPRLFADGSLQPDSISALAPADQALLTYTGLSKSLPSDRRAKFTNPRIDCIDSRVLPLGRGWYRVELYFLPLTQPVRDYTIAVRVSTTDSIVAAPGGLQSDALQFDFDPHLPTSNWPPERVVMATKRIYFDGRISGIKMGLYDRAVNPVVFVPVEGSNQTMIDLQVPESAEN